MPTYCTCCRIRVGTWCVYAVGRIGSKTTCLCAWRTRDARPFGVWLRVRIAWVAVLAREFASWWGIWIWFWGAKFSGVRMGWHIAMAMGVCTVQCALWSLGTVCGVVCTVGRSGRRCNRRVTRMGMLNGHEFKLCLLNRSRKKREKKRKKRVLSFIILSRVSFCWFTPLLGWYILLRGPRLCVGVCQAASELLKMAVHRSSVTQRHEYMLPWTFMTFMQSCVMLEVKLEWVVPVEGCLQSGTFRSCFVVVFIIECPLQVGFICSNVFVAAYQRAASDTTCGKMLPRSANVLMRGVSELTSTASFQPRCQARTLPCAKNACNAVHCPFWNHGEWRTT